MAVTHSFVLGREQCFQQIERLTKSHSLHSSESLCRLLRYLAEHSLDHPGVALKEYQIATEVLGRPPGFDPQSDSTVPVQAGRLRVKLAEYYANEGALDPIVVEIPKGSYALTFHVRPGVSAATVGPSLVPAPVKPEIQPAPSSPRLAAAVIALSVLLAFSLTVTAILLSQRTGVQTAANVPVPAAYQLFWNRFVTGPQQPWIIFSN